MYTTASHIRNDTGQMFSSYDANGNPNAHLQRLGWKQLDPPGKKMACEALPVVRCSLLVDTVDTPFRYRILSR